MSTLVPIVFRFPHALAPNAHQIAVLGSFNGWAPTAHPLTKTAQGDWAITIYLPPGRVLYHFSVDGTFRLDPSDEGRVPNSWDSEYSVRYVRNRSNPLHTPVGGRYNELSRQRRRLPERSGDT